MASEADHRSDDSLPSPLPIIPGMEGDDDDLPQCKIKRNYSCSLCSFFSQNPRSFLYHSRDVHFDKIKIYECSKCLYASKHSQKLQRHINMIHIPGKTQPKKVMPKRVVEKREVKPPPMPPAPPQQTSEDLSSPPMGSESKVKCSMCSFTSRSAALITRHERVVHLKKRFLRCTKCTYVTHVKARFTKHVKYHSMPMIKCDLCDFRTPYKWNLDRHYKNHCGSGAFQCSKCNFRADIKQSLTVHEMNHHVPPVGAGAAILMRKKNKVGASETTALESDGIDQDELELLRLEREEEGEQEQPKDEESDDEEPDLNADIPEPTSKLQTALNRPLPAKQPRLQGAFLHPEAAAKGIKCKFCSYRGTFVHEVARHEKRIHGFVRDKRPPPNLIPIQGQPSSPILRIPEVRSKRLQAEEPTPPVNEEEFNEMCKKSSLTSSLKEFVSLIGDEEALKTIPDASHEQDSSLSSNSDTKHFKKSQTDLLKRKNASFFEKLKEKLISGGNEEFSLMCEICGHESKCLSESVAHEKKHLAEKEELVVSGTELTSTRCQHCRHRCKTSADLITHLKTCKAFGAAYGNQQMERSSDETEEGGESSRVFVWNELPRNKDEELGEDETFESMETEAYGSSSPPEFPPEALETQLDTLEPDTPPKLARAPRVAAEPARQHRGLSLKKVFKCPHCSFWASTASRFHVHIVGHLNKKPFECSLCSYRSNWRWDITKHIRLKSARDPNHTTATVNMTDETGRRNYSKYNKYLTMMKVSEPTADSSGTGRRTRACEATQGTVRDGDILQPIPEPPRLTPAPLPGAPQALPHGSTLRPPPPLQAAHLSSVCKRTLWKCKKCLYRNSDKDKVLAHVKSHYSKRTSATVVTSDDALADDEEMEGDEPQRYKCGHCYHASNWRQVIQRHCRIKHRGSERILPCTKADKDLPSLDDPEIEPSSSNLCDTASTQPGSDDIVASRDTTACNICPFTAKTAGDLTAHKLNHIDRPGSIFKCTFCPFYVPSKIAVLEHMEIHGVERGENSKLNIDNFDPSECWEPIEGDSEELKRYRCRQCPYVSNSKTQFLYHKQFHRPRDAPFKCLYCSYNVSRRHLLHQHLRVHHNRKSGDLDLPDIPLVWVLRGGTYLKMFKCRWCPHVNLRRANIQEHEKMHRDQRKLQCPDCSYTCKNPGVLSAHGKVHAGYFGEIRSLVDPTRSDDEQIQNLQNTSANEPEIVIKVEEPEEPSTPESSYYQSNTMDEENNAQDDAEARTISFCNKCPARFFYKKELRIHSKFHLIRLPFKCSFCSYTARQRPHLLAHFKVHSQEFQERTASLVDTYMVCHDHQQPKTAMVTTTSDLLEGPVWSVISQENLSAQPARAHTKPGKPSAKHACHRCPAKFFKLVALQYHLTLHGGSHQHRCKFCDYTVKTYGNLIKHQLIHETPEAKGADRAPPVKVEVRPKTPEKKTDPQFGMLMHGSPNFVYPTYLKNGKLKEKRYKCHKCPSAFEKRDQYRIHLTLHGSKQKYNCEKCDYSVKYYANYIQHVKKHVSNEEARQARGMEIKLELDDDDLYHELTPPPLPPPPLTQIERQMLILLERKRKLSKEDDRKMFECELCPYTNMRRDCLENHERRHYILSGIRYGFDCRHCDYSTTQANFLREHSRVHFKSPRQTPEAFLLVQGLELCLGKDEDQLEWETLFKDCGENRFDPPLADNEEEEDVDEASIIFINPSTREPIGEEDDEEAVAEEGPDFEVEMIVPDSPIEPDIREVSPEADDLIEMVEEQFQEKPKVKRLRGKNWRCKKCPHAFGKRDQFMRHISLHGSQQRYSCDICDYSVKFYTNYVQHMRMHKSHEPDRDVVIKPYVSGPEVSPTAVEEPDTELDSEAEQGAVELMGDADVSEVAEDAESDCSDASSSPLPSHLVEMTMVESEMEVVT